MAWPLMPHVDLAWQSSAVPPESRQIVTFDEPGFPEVDAFPLRAVSGARVTTSTAELIDALRPGAVLVWRHGSAFPAEAWKAIHRFSRRRRRPSAMPAVSRGRGRSLASEEAAGLNRARSRSCRRSG